MPNIAKLLKLKGNRRADVGRWSGSLAKEDGLVPKDKLPASSQLARLSSRQIRIRSCSSADL